VSQSPGRAVAAAECFHTPNAVPSRLIRCFGTEITCVLCIEQSVQICSTCSTYAMCSACCLFNCVVFSRFETSHTHCLLLIIINPLAHVLGTLTDKFLAIFAWKSMPLDVRNFLLSVITATEP
jgi:hypothetical protein